METNLQASMLALDQIWQQASDRFSSDGRASIEVVVRVYDSASDYWSLMTGVHIPLGMAMLGTALVAMGWFTQALATRRAD